MIKATLEFYEKNLAGEFDTEPSIYIAGGNSKEDILDGQEYLWQAIEIEGYDNAEVLVFVEFEEDGVYLDRDEFVMTAEVVRTSEPSNYVVWGNKKPHIFKIDREHSKIHIEPQ